MMLQNIPEDINIELLLSYLPDGQCKTALRGQHKRNAYYDIIAVKERKGVLHIEVGRDSLYNALPEIVFHPIDRFGDLGTKEKDNAFIDEYDKQDEERSSARTFFAPMDTQLLLLRRETRELMRSFTETDSVLIDLLADRLSDRQRANRFIRHAIPFLPYCKTIRGNKTLLSLLLRKVFMEEKMIIEPKEQFAECSDPQPRYADGPEAILDNCYVGNVFDELITTYYIHYWSEEDCNEHFQNFLDDVEMFRLFIQDYFMSLEMVLHFDITNDELPLRLSDDIFYNYLSYNTNI